MIDIELAGGALFFLVFIVGYLGAVIHGLYTTKGSGIDNHPYGNRYGGAPGAWGRERRRPDMAGWSRGTR